MIRDDKQVYRTNQEIKASEIRLLGPDNKQIGVLKLTEALKKAEEAEADLVEIAPAAKPPVVRLIEIGKFKYELDKKKRKEKRGVRTSEVKEIRFTPFIAEGDFQTRIQRVKEFLGEGNKIRVVVKYKGRQMGQKSFGYDIIRRVLAEVGEVNIDMEPKFIGRHLTSVISPMSGKRVNEERRKDAKTKNKKDSN